MMKGLIKQAAAALGLGAVVAGAGGCCCYGYRDLVDPCYPERYEYMARQEVHGAFAPQVQNGRALDQTVWDWDFEPGIDRLTPGGMEHLDYIVRRRPQPYTTVYVQTAKNVGYDPVNPDRTAEARSDLDSRRVLAVQKYLLAKCAGRGLDFQVLVHDPADQDLSAAWDAVEIAKMYARPQGGLTTTGGGGASGGGGSGGGGGGGSGGGGR
jgi:uncharacterized membrane protein YgcG